MATKIRHETITASELRDGDVMRIGSSTNYVLVAKAECVPDGIAVTIYNGDTPSDGPYRTFKPSTKVDLSMRNRKP